MKQSVYIFDVDGVLNNLHIYEPDPRIITCMADLLDNGTYVAINTGRSYSWVKENVVDAIKQKLHSSEPLNRLFVAVEMGGLGTEFRDGQEQKNPSAFSLPQEHIDLVRSTFEAHPEYADRLHWYEKESMATLDKNGNTALEVFQPAQKELTEILKRVFDGQHVKVANSTDAVDVHAPEAGKWAGAQLIYEWLRRTTDIHHDHFVCFGDSIVDYEMARFFAEQSHDTVFVFTGQTYDNTTPHPNIEMIKTEQPYHEGTYAYLRDHTPQQLPAGQ